MATDDEALTASTDDGPWRAILDASPIPTAITRRHDGSILFVNPACLAMLGWSREEVVGRTMVEVGFWQAPEERARMLEQLASENGVHDLEHTITTRSGEALVALTSISAVQFGGEPCLVGHVVDVTERRRLEARAHETEVRFLQVTETLQQGFLLREATTRRVLYASPSMERIFGLDRDTIYGDPGSLERLLHPEDREPTLTQREAMQGTANFEFRIVRPDGETRWIRSRAEPVGIQGGRATRIASVSEDITAERALREALRASEVGFRLLAENSTDVIARSSPDWRIRYISPASRELYGFEPEEMIGHSGWEFVHPDDQIRLSGELSANFSAAGDVTNSYRVRRKDGAYTWVEAKTHALRHPVSDHVIEFHTFARDISERRAAEAAFRRGTEEAEQANFAKSEFLSRMSHELRTPLHAILGFGELLAREDLAPPLRDGLEQITKGGRHLLELINEILDISAIERGELRLSLEPVHVGMVVGEALAMIAPLATARAITLSAPPEHELDCYVIADRHRLKQVLLNLLSNAVKYNRDGGDVGVGISRDETGRVRVEVSDSGIGIAPENLDGIFAAFERLGAETTDVEGTGLGLTLTKRLMEAMGGDIAVASQVGSGTTFSFALSAVGAPQPRSLAPARTVAEVDVLAQRQMRTILYIEDNPSNVRLAEAILAQRPEVTLLVATQAGLGLELAHEHRPAVILLDLNLPDMSGEQVLRRIRNDPRTAQTTVVVLSADATPGQIARLRRAGADDYLTKPFEIEQFLAVVDGEPSGGQMPDPAVADADDTGPLRLDRVGKLRRLYPEAGELHEFVALFLTDISTRLDILQTAAGEGDAPAVWQAAHAMRGSCSLAGAHRVEAVLARFEAIARDDAVPGAEQIAMLRATYADAAQALAGELR